MPDVLPKSLPRLFVGKHFGNTFPFSDPLGCMNSRQEGKLTNGLRLLARDRNGKAKGMSRLRVFLAIRDQHLILTDGKLVR